MKSASLALLTGALAVVYGCASAHRAPQLPPFFVEADAGRIVHVFASDVLECRGFGSVNQLQLLQHDIVVGGTPLGPFAAAAAVTRGGRVYLRVSGLLPSLEAFRPASLSPERPSPRTDSTLPSASLQPGTYRVRAVCGSVLSSPSEPIFLGH